MPKTKSVDKATEHAWKFDEIHRNVHRLKFDFANTKERFETLWISDLHWDNPKCDRTTLKRHLDQAVKRDAPIIVVGDFFCAMQGKWDKRADKSCIRPEHQDGDYLDKLVTTAAEWFKPYYQHLVLIGYGNHETGIKKRHETDLIGRLCQLIRANGGITRAGGYNGWLQYKFEWFGSRKTFNFHYAHGSGGGAPVTKGAINFNRWREQVTSDAFIAGHIHRRNANDQIVADLTDQGRIVKRQLDYIRCSTYKDDYTDGAQGWHNELQMGPRPIGGYWCEWKTTQQGGSKEYRRRWIPTD